MKKLLLIAFIGLGIHSGLRAQGGMDFGINLGGANYMGEIGGDEGEAKPWLLDMNFQQTSFTFGGFYRYHFTDRLAAKFQLNFVRIQGADSLSNEPTRIARNLSFRTDIVEAMLTGEFNFFIKHDMNRRSRKRVDFNAYAFAGIGALLYYPHAKMNDEWYYLRPLATEGIDNEYDEMTIAVPLGLGAHFTFNHKTRIGLEVGYRFSFTDYLDDISTRYAPDNELPFAESIALADRSDEVYLSGKYDDLPDPGFYGAEGTNRPIRGNPDTNDGYVLVQFNVSYVIGGGNSFYRSRYKSLINRKRARRKF